jgi:hypothetical protein
MESGAGPPPKLLFAAFIFRMPVKFGLSAAPAVPASSVTATRACRMAFIAILRRTAGAKVRGDAIDLLTGSSDVRVEAGAEER